MQALLLCLDVSGSMGYGEPTKLNVAINTIQRAIRGLTPETKVGLVSFDVTAEVVLDMQPLVEERIRGKLRQATPRGVSCIAAGLTEALKLIEKGGDKGEVLLLTDGRANLSRDRTGGYEGSLKLERELLEIAQEAKEKNIIVHAVAVGEDAFTHTLAEIAENTKGRYWIADDLQVFADEAVTTQKILKTSELRVHSAPAELPSAQPTWTKESQSIHVAVVSQSLYEAYRAHRRAFLLNQSKHREARTGLIPIDAEVLAAYRRRRPGTAEMVRNEEAILIDRSYRDYLSLGKDAIVKLVIR